MHPQRTPLSEGLGLRLATASQEDVHIHCLHFLGGGESVGRDTPPQLHPAPVPAPLLAAPAVTLPCLSPCCTSPVCSHPSPLLFMPLPLVPLAPQSRGVPSTMSSCLESFIQSFDYVLVSPSDWRSPWLLGVGREGRDVPEGKRHSALVFPLFCRNCKSSWFVSRV